MFQCRCEVHEVFQLTNRYDYNITVSNFYVYNLYYIQDNNDGNSEHDQYLNY